jgi:hypothetical protein
MNEIKSVFQLNRILSIDPKNEAALEYIKNNEICTKCGARKIDEEMYEVHFGPHMTKEKLCARVCILLKGDDKLNCLNKDTTLTSKEKEELSFKPLGL